MARERESLGRRSARTFSVMGVSRMISLLLGVLTIIVVARMLGPAGYGIYTIGYAFFLLVSATSNFGFGVYLTKHLAEFEDTGDRKRFSSSLASAYLLVIAIGLVLTLVGIAGSDYIASFFPGSGVAPLTLVLASSIIFFAMLYGTSDYALIGLGKNFVAAVLENAENIVLLFAAIILILLGYGPNGAIAGILISYVFAAAVGTYLVFRFAHVNMGVRVTWPTAGELKSAFNFSIPIAVNNFLNNGMVNFATLFLGSFVTIDALGNYGVAGRARAVLTTFYNTAAVTLLPTLAIAIAREGSNHSSSRLPLIYNKALLYSVITTVPLIAYLGVFSKPLIYLFISRAFSSAPLYLSMIALGSIIGLIGVFAVNLFVARGKTSKLLVYSLIVALAQLAALAVLVPPYGVMGAIIAIFFVGSVASDYLFLVGAKRVLGIKLDYGKLGLAFASNVVLAALFAPGLLLARQSLQLAYGLAVLLLLYPPLLVLSRAIDREDLDMFRKSLSSLGLLRSFAKPLLDYFNFLSHKLQ